jgi:dihydrofolate reductase
MGRLLFSSIVSLDGYTNDRDGRFDWAVPDGELHAYVNDLVRPVDTYLFGRRMYEVMSVWDSLDVQGQPDYIKDFAEIWRAADKVVYSTTLDDVSSDRTTLVTSFDPETVRERKKQSAGDLAVGGPGLAAHAFRAGLVDELLLFVVPVVVVGGGTRALPKDVRLDLELLEERRFGNGTVLLRHAVLPG